MNLRKYFMDPLRTVARLLGALRGRDPLLDPDLQLGDLLVEVPRLLLLLLLLLLLGQDRGRQEGHQHQLGEIHSGEICTVGYLRVTLGHPMVTIGHPRVTIGHLRATMDHLSLTQGYLRVTI